nr:FecR domain-containing protein [uncultured Prevotella sp.]
MKELIEIDEILGKYFANEPIAENERMALIAFKNANKVEFDTLNNIMAQTETTETKDFNTEVAWNRIENRLTNDTPQYTKALKLRSVFSIAASLLLLIGVGTLAYHYFVETERTTFANTSTIASLVTLPDGTDVTLSPQASLSFEEQDGKRIAALEGQAFFNVEHTDKPFTVEAGALKVEVLGTSFKVDATLQDTESVAVATGRVRVSTNSQAVTLTKGESVVHKNGKLIAKKQGNAQTEVKEFVFNNTPLATAIKEIEQGMDVQIETEKNLLKNRITTKLHTNNPEKVVAELAMLCNCRYETLSSIHYRLHR